MIFTGPGGQTPSIHILKLAEAAQVTVGDALYAGQALRTRIRTRTAQGIAFDGSPFPAYSKEYRKRKVLMLGHADAVDLFGPDNHPHMLNAISVVSGGTILATGQSASTSPLELPEPSAQVSLVIFGEAEAMRARVHNEGATVTTRLGKGKGKAKKGGKATFNMPRRRFFDASADDQEFMVFAIGKRRQERMAMTSGGGGANAAN